MRMAAVLHKRFVFRRIAPQALRVQSGCKSCTCA